MKELLNHELKLVAGGVAPGGVTGQGNLTAATTGNPPFAHNATGQLPGDNSNSGLDAGMGKNTAPR